MAEGNPFMDSWQLLLQGRIDEVDVGMLAGFMRWRCGNKKDLPLMREINRKFYTTDHRTLLWDIYFDVDRASPFVRTPKRLKDEEDKKFELVSDELKKIYHWGKTEVQYNRAIINLLLKDKEFLEQLAERSGFDKQQCKILGLEKKDFKVDKPKKEESASLFSF